MTAYFEKCYLISEWSVKTLSKQALLLETPSTELVVTDTSTGWAPVHFQI